MMQSTYERAALLLQVETYDLAGQDYYKLMVVWREDKHTFHEVHLAAEAVYADPKAGERVAITYLMDTPLRVAPLGNTSQTAAADSQQD